VYRSERGSGKGEFGRIGCNHHITDDCNLASVPNGRTIHSGNHGLGDIFKMPEGSGIDANIFRRFFQIVKIEFFQVCPGTECLVTCPGDDDSTNILVDFNHIQHLVHFLIHGCAACIQFIRTIHGNNRKTVFLFVYYGFIPICHRYLLR